MHETPAPSSAPSPLRVRSARDSIAVRHLRDRVAKIQSEYRERSTQQADFVGTHIAEARAAGKIADRLHAKPGAALPDGWQRVPSNLGDDLKDAGAAYLQSPTGMKYIAFSKDAAANDVSGRIRDTFGKPSKMTEAAHSLGRRMMEVADVTYAGAGRGGALAKLAAESASFDKAKRVADVTPKLCVAINAHAIDPKTYAAFGLSANTHSRNTLNVEFTKDAKDRVTAAYVLRADPRANDARARAAEAILRADQTARRNAYGARAAATPGVVAPPAPTPAQAHAAYEHVRSLDRRIGAEGDVKISKSLDPGDKRIGGKAQFASPDFTRDVVRQRLGQAAQPTGYVDAADTRKPFGKANGFGRDGR